jgi:hypothetical protein
MSRQRWPDVGMNLLCARMAKFYLAIYREKKTILKTTEIGSPDIQTITLDACSQGATEAPFEQGTTT